MLKTYKSITPSQRQLCLINKQSLAKKIILNKLSCYKKKCVGRNNQGGITVYHKGSGNKNKYRNIHTRNTIFNVPARIITTEYNPYSSNHVYLVYFLNGIYCYISSISNLQTQQLIYNYINCSNTLKIGDRTLIKYINYGTQINNIQNLKFLTNKLIKSAGTYGILLRIKKKTALIKLPSSVVINTNVNTLATIGCNGNKLHRKINYGKAGRIRWLGIRPTVRGVAMNPVDHPHGGGEGKKTKKSHPRTPWGRK